MKIYGRRWTDPTTSSITVHVTIARRFIQPCRRSATAGLLARLSRADTGTLPANTRGVSKQWYTSHELYCLSGPSSGIFVAQASSPSYQIAK